MVLWKIFLWVRIVSDVGRCDQSLRMLLDLRGDNEGFLKVVVYQINASSHAAETWMLCIDVR